VIGSIHDSKKISGKKNDLVSGLLTHTLNYFKDYNPQDTFPLYGFGGQLLNDPEENVTSRCFALGGKSIYEPECDGLNNVLSAYFTNRDKIKKGEVTNLKKIIE